MNEIISKMESPEFRLLMYDDITETILKGGASLELAQALQFILVSFYKEDYTSEQIEDQVLRVHESILEAGGYRQKRNFQQEVADVVSFLESGTIHISDVYNHLKVIETHEKGACRMAMNRLVARGIVEKVDGGRGGTYRVIKNNAEQTQFLTAPKGEFKITLPLNLSQMGKIFPGNLVIVAGSKSSGKTAFLLNTALANQNKHKVVYLNSEMGDEEFTERMIRLGCNSPEDIKFKCYRKASDFHDLVKDDDAIYIIDFLEIHDKFYEIGKHLKQIHDKLKNGVAIVAIQMKGGERLGRGGDFSKEVSRLYLSMDYQPEMKCTRVGIEEMKSPKIPEGYRNWFRYVKIVDGSRLSPVGDWSEGGSPVYGNGQKAASMGRRF